MRLRAVALAGIGLALFAAPGAFAQAPSAQPPAAAAPSAEDQARLQLEARLKEFQRREQFEDMSLPERKRLLENIINYSIELNRDFSAYTDKLNKVQQQIKAEEQTIARAQQRERANKLLRDRALQAMAATPPQWEEAARLLNQAIRLAPNDPETLALKAQADIGLRNLFIRRVVLGMLGGLATVGVLAGVWQATRKGSTGRPRRLEMIEGPQPGEQFPLEKETTVLGALPAESDWVIDDPARRISRRHCDISRSGRHYFLTDRSSNGTYVNGKPAPKGEPILLRKGDRIALAEDVVLKFR